MALKKVGLAVAGTAAAGALILGGATLADAATDRAGPSGAPGGYGPGEGYGPGRPHDGGPGRPHDGGPGPRGGTEVTGDELAKVTAAVKAKDAAASVTGARKTPDGSYHVQATKAGKPTGYEVGSDLKTVTERQGGPGKGGPGRGGPRGGAEVTGDELTKVTAAVTAKDPAATVTGAHKTPDGSYHVHATKAGKPLAYEVGADLKTVTERPAGPRPGGRPGGPRPVPSATD